MAPRSAKAKKATDVKVADAEAPKRGRGRAKNVEEVEPEADMEVSEKPVIEKKKRGKKAIDTNDQEDINSDEKAPTVKKGRKKVEDPALEAPANGDEAEEDTAPTEEPDQNDENVESNGNTEDKSVGRGRKKQPKKEAEKPEPRGRGRKAKADSVEVESSEKEVEKPRAGRGRGRKAQPKEEDENSAEEDVKPEPTRGRKKQMKAKEETDSGKEDLDDEDLEDKVEEPKKTKGRKNQGKKAQAKDDEKEDDAPSKRRKAPKKDEKGDAKDEDVEDEPTESRPAKGKRGQKKAETTETEEEPQEVGEPTSKRRRKAPEDKAPEDAKKKAPPKNKASTDYEELDFSNTSKSPQGKDWNFKIASWNVDGIRAWMSKGGLDYIKYEKPDILCLQEVKCSKDKLPEEVVNVAGYHAYWLCSEKDGYAGVGIYTTQLAMNVQYGLQDEELDAEGRIITAEYEQFYLICTYVPNAGRKLVSLPKRLQWNEEFRKYVKELDKKKPVIICGDMNVSHNEIDLTNPKTNRKNAGFTDEERAGMTELLGDGFVDTYRHLYPERTGVYTFWTYMMNCRAKNVGWRLDYFIVSERLLPSLCDSVIRDEVYGSDHCPISLCLHLSSAVKPKE